jgi:hypothetical protein
MPGKKEVNEPYGSTTYYGHKVIFRSENDNIYVATVPSSNQIVEPQIHDYRNLDIILKNITALKCDLYSNSLIPVVLANKSVSLAAHPKYRLVKSFCTK